MLNDEKTEKREVGKGPQKKGTPREVLQGQ